MAAATPAPAPDRTVGNVRALRMPVRPTEPMATVDAREVSAAVAARTRAEGALAAAARGLRPPPAPADSAEYRAYLTQFAAADEDVFIAEMAALLRLTDTPTGVITQVFVDYARVRRACPPIAAQPEAG